MFERKEWPLYNPQSLSGWSEKELRAEYKTLRKVANDRLRRMVNKWSWTESFKQNVGQFLAPGLLLSKTDLVYKLSQVSQFLNNESSSASGQRAIMDKSLKTLHERGYDFVDAGNYKDFSQFMGFYKDAFDNSLLDSDRVAQWYAQIKDDHPRYGKKRVKKEFEKWAKAQIEDMRALAYEGANNSKVYRMDYSKGK